MSDRDGMLDIHGKCRREREELQAKLAEAEHERDEAQYNWARLTERVEQLETILTLAETWRADLDAEPLAVMSRVLSPSEWALATAVVALAAAEQSGPRRATSGQTSGEDGVCPDCGGEGKVYASDGEDSYYSEPCPNDIAHAPRPLKAWAAFPGPAVSGAGQAGEEVNRG